MSLSLNSATSASMVALVSVVATVPMENTSARVIMAMDLEVADIFVTIRSATPATMAHRMRQNVKRLAITLALNLNSCG